MDTIIVFALPVFALLMAAEWIYGWRIGRNTYRLNDSLSSLSLGVLSQAIAVCTQFFQIGLYTIAYRRLSQFHHAGLWQTALGWLLAVVLFDFCDYWLHRTGHETAVFWAAHVVHHQSQEFNFSTALRQESLVAILGWPFYLPLALAGVPPAQFALAGLIVLLYQFWIHTEHIGKLGWFDRVFSSPSNHRVHHAINPQYVNKNYGGMLVVWDRLFGTFAEEREPCVYGTQAPLAGWNPLWAVPQVYASLAQDAWHTRRWQDKLRIWLMPPGWRPADLSARCLQPPLRTTDTPRFDPPVTRTDAAFAVAEFILATAGTAMLLWRADRSLTWGHAALACLGIAAGLWTIGSALQGRMGPLRGVVLNLPIIAIVVWALA